MAMRPSGSLISLLEAAFIASSYRLVQDKENFI